VKLSDLAGAQEITVPYLEQIFAKLKQAGLVKSVRGPGGGYILGKPASQLHISDVVMAVEEPMKMTRCDKHGVTGCLGAGTRCTTHDLWEGLEKHIFTYLSSISLADVRRREFPHARGLDKLLATAP
jgi:Rrf2 family iron-sulfur cluster assembly transcriptional regulator